MTDKKLYDNALFVFMQFYVISLLIFVLMLHFSLLLLLLLLLFNLISLLGAFIFSSSLKPHVIKHNFTNDSHSYNIWLVLTLE